MEDKRDISPGERALASRVLSNVQADEKKWEEDFKRMEENARYASGKQWPEFADSCTADSVVVNFIQRHIQQSTSAIYAKNPKAVATPRKGMDYAVWDGDESSLTTAFAAAQMAMQQGLPVPNEAAAVIQDAEAGSARRQMAEKVAKTLECLYEYELSQQDVDFKQEMKQLVRRVRTAGVGYVKMGYRDKHGLTSDEQPQTGGIEQQLVRIQELITKVTDEKGDTSSLEADEYELQLILEATGENPRPFKEGLMVTFPESDSIIPDKDCMSLMGFAGASRVTQMHCLSPDQIENIYGRDISDSISQPQDGQHNGEMEVETVKVYEVWDKQTGLVFEVADGVEGFLRDPSSPYCITDNFWPFEVLMFNQLPDDERIFPMSDVDFLKPIQDEYNRTREGFREHRFANRPGYAAKKGSITDEEMAKISNRRANDIVSVNLLEGQRISDVLEPINTKGVDPNQYTTNHLVEDVVRVTGTSEPALTGAGGDTATGDSIAESHRMSGMSSNVDDLDGLLSRMANLAKQILMTKRQAEDVKRIVGPGAVWPEFTAQERADELVLSVKAGSSGRPNKAAELQNFERIAPTLLQIPGISPQWLAEEAIKRMDDGLEISDAIMEGLPSIIAQNSMTQVATGDPATSPEAQGGQGAMNEQGPERVDAIPTPTQPDMG